jgi:hypothetical protein
MVVARTWLEIARPWRDDAMPWRMEIEPWKNGEFVLKIMFVSPRDQAGMSVKLYKFQHSVTKHDKVTWPPRAMPADFIDLPQAIEIYTQHGRPGPYKRFVFGYEKYGGWGWAAVPKVDRGGKMFSVTFDGKTDRDLRSDYINWYNETWAKIVAPLQRALAAAAAVFLLGSASDDNYWAAACNHRYGHGAWSSARNSCDPDPYKRGY